MEAIDITISINVLNKENTPVILQHKNYNVKTYKKYYILLTCKCYYDLQSYKKLLKMQPQDVQVHFQELKQAPQLFSMEMKLN